MKRYIIAAIIAGLAGFFAGAMNKQPAGKSDARRETVVTLRV